MSRRTGETSCSTALRCFLRTFLSFPALPPMKPSPPKGLRGVHLRVTWTLVVRLVTYGSGLASCCQGGRTLLCQLSPHKSFCLGLCCCYPSCSWSLRELLWEVFSLCQACRLLTDTCKYYEEGQAMKLHLISV